MRTATRTDLHVGDIMTKEPVCAEPGMGIRQLARLFEENEISGAPVVGDDGKLIGVVSKTDLLRRCSEGTGQTPPGYLFELLSDEAGEDTELMPEAVIAVEDFMTIDPITARKSDLLGPVARRMAECKVHRVIVVDAANVPVGIVTSLDLLKVFPQS